MEITDGDIRLYYSIPLPKHVASNRKTIFLPWTRFPFRLDHFFRFACAVRGLLVLVPPYLGGMIDVRPLHALQVTLRNGVLLLRGRAEDGHRTSGIGPGTYHGEENMERMRYTEHAAVRLSSFVGVVECFVRRVTICWLIALFDHVPVVHSCDGEPHAIFFFLNESFVSWSGRVVKRLGVYCLVLSYRAVGAENDVP